MVKKRRGDRILPYPDHTSLRKIELMVRKDEALRSKRVLHFLAQQPSEVQNLWISLTFPLLTEEDRQKFMKRRKSD